MTRVNDNPSIWGWGLGGLAVLAIAMGGCSTSSPSSSTATTDTDATATGSGTLEIRANGEDFVRQGFTSKDGWAIQFDHVYVNLADITAYQTDPAYDAQSDQPLQAKESISLTEPQTVDLAAGDDAADPVLVAAIADVPAGQYNALSWDMPVATTGPAAGAVILLDGTASKDGETVEFVMTLDQPLAFQCGDFVGESRKGILEAEQAADLEATFHFDHLFGDGDAPADDSINTGALGFDPLAALATAGTVEVDQAALEAQLSPENYQLLMEILPSLGHVGEGHCQETELSS